MVAGNRQPALCMATADAERRGLFRFPTMARHTRQPLTASTLAQHLDVLRSRNRLTDSWMATRFIPRALLLPFTFNLFVVLATVFNVAAVNGRASLAWFNWHEWRVGFGV